MAKIINFGKLKTSLKSNIFKAKKTVIAGGCFDILHIGHIKFLQEAKKKGDLLIILLESDKRVKEIKGKNKPIFKLAERAQMLAALSFVDYIILLPYMNEDKDYQSLIMYLKPDIITATANDPNLEKKERQAETVHAQLKTVPFIKTYSTSKLVSIVGID